MKTYEQRCAEVAAKITKMKRERRLCRMAVSGACLGLIVILTLALFLPLDTGAPSISQYADSPYYSLMQRINEATYERPRFQNNFEKLTSQLDRAFGSVTKGEPDFAVPEEIFTETDSNLGNANGGYVEVTDNQVAGVTEGDLIKRSDKYIFYLREGKKLCVYSIAAEKSQQVGEFTLTDTDINAWYEGEEMYLSRDCSTVFVIRSCYWKEDGKDGAYTVVTALDVTDVNEITVKEEIYMTGNYLSSRMVGDDLMLMGQYYIRGDKDFSDPATFLPMVGPRDDLQPIAAEDIFAPEELTTTRYTVVCKLDGGTMSVQDSAAFLSYSQELYVSASAIYATRTYTEKTKTGSRTMTQITALDYSGEDMANKGSVSIAGAVKNQYSMDEYEGILRVVTSTTEQVTGVTDDLAFAANRRNVNLSCIDLQTMEVVAQVEAFAPEGETAESVRFDGNKAYVCTAEVITLTDPVYFFDLSDLNNITWKDTGTIDGYSSSLVNFRDGYLLGIGYGGSRELKIEIYDQIGDGVESVCSYERSATFSEEYKSYLIDRENGLVGLALQDWDSNGGRQYILLMFDGYELRQLVEMPIGATRLDEVRAVLIDGWLYVLSNEFQVCKVW